MRLTFARILTATVSVLAFYACDNGSTTTIGTPAGYGGASSTLPDSNGGAQQGTTDQGQGGSSNASTSGTSTSTGTTGGSTSSSSSAGGSSANSSSSTGGAATGGKAATGGASCTPAPLSSWKSFAACKATTAAMDTAYKSWKSSYFVSCGSNEAYIKSTDPNGSNAVVSEGIGYGMLAAANLNQSDDFARLWAFYKARLNGNGVMGWKYPVSCTGGAQDSNAASDADIDAAMALIVAAKTFNNSNYLNDAKTLIASVKRSETLTNCSGGRYALKASDGGWANCDELNPSYFAPGYYRVFGTVTNDATFWNKMATDALALLAQWQNKTGNGTVPDWGRSDGSLGSPSHSSGNTYGYDACRVPWRVAVDYGWNQTAEAKSFLTKMYEGILKKDRPFFAIDPSSQNSSPYVGGFSLVGTAIDQATCDMYFTDWYNRSLDGDNTYYANTLRLLYLITAGGHFDNGQ